MVFKWCSIGTKGPKVWQENIPHTITPPAPAWTVETRQDGSMLSCSLRQIMTLSSECSRNQDSSDQATFFNLLLSSFGDPVWIVVSTLRVLFLADRSGTGVVFCCWSPSASGFDVLCVKIPVDQQFVKYSDQSVWHQQPFHVQSLKSSFFPVLMLGLNFSKSSSPHLDV